MAYGDSRGISGHTLLLCTYDRYCLLSVPNPLLGQDTAELAQSSALGGTLFGYSISPDTGSQSRRLKHFVPSVGGVIQCAGVDAVGARSFLRLIAGTQSSAMGKRSRLPSPATFALSCATMSRTSTRQLAPRPIGSSHKELCFFACLHVCLFVCLCVCVFEFVCETVCERVFVLGLVSIGNQRKKPFVDVPLF